MKVIHNFCQVLFGFIFTGNIGEFDAFGGFHINLGVALAHTKHHGIFAAAHLVHELLGHILAQGKENDQWENPCEQETDQWGHLFNNLAGEFCTRFIKSFCTVRIIHQTGLVNLGFILIRENNLIAFNFNFANLFLLSHADESAVIDLFHAVLLNQRHNECIENNEDEQNDCIVVKPVLFWSFDFIHNIRPPYNACF